MTNCNKCGKAVSGSSMYCPACYDEMEQNARLDFENTQLRARIAELEAAQQWHPASEPPEAYNEVLILVEFQYDEGHHVWEKGWHDGDRFHFCNVNCETRNYIVFGWRDLPPMPEVKK